MPTADFSLSREEKCRTGQRAKGKHDFCLFLGIKGKTIFKKE